MHGAAVLAELERAGLKLSVLGDRLIVQPASRLTPQVRETIRSNKPALLTALAEFSAENLRHEYEERAAIGEFDAGLPRAVAERQAWDSVVVLWLNDPGNAGSQGVAGFCGACHCPLDDVAIPVLRADSGHTWLHDRCVRSWCAIRRADAERALAEIGISPPPT